MVVAVFRRAWICEDAFITLRYVENVLQGHGAVYNLGERVQGYTHVLWFLPLVPGCLVFGDPILVTMGYGIALTLLSLLLWGCALIRLAGRLAVAACLYAVSCLVWIFSDCWLSFQTSGLENSLSNLLLIALVAECALHAAERPARLAFLIALLCLTRPDFAFFCAPLGVLLVFRIRSWRTAAAMLLAILPGLVWLVFAGVYYGEAIPNAVRAGMGVYPDRFFAAMRGSVYVADWALYDTVAAVATAVAVMAYVVFAWRHTALRACALGLLLHVSWVVWVGGDLVRGRLLVPILVSGLALGCAAVALWVREGRGIPWMRTEVAAFGVLALFAIERFTPLLPGALPWMDIVAERSHYPGYSMQVYLRDGKLAHPRLNLSLADSLRDYADACGPVTVHLRNPGAIGYLAGPTVSFIDLLGLTDRYIARLPREYLSNPYSKPGQPDKYIPVSYLVSRGDVALLPGWHDAIRAKDASLRERLRGLDQTGFLYPGVDADEIPMIVHPLQLTAVTAIEESGAPQQRAPQHSPEGR